jgi:bifunctional UDP-N-acetylglucosamine pyrophosphorylase/glucosamine-1-phosphate N-acetyltransferase
VSNRTVAMVLAAGKGTRMRSNRAKVLHPVLGRAMVHYPVDAALAGGADHVVVVVGQQREAVQDTLRARFAPDTVSFAVQHALKGTADAVSSGYKLTDGYDTVVILCGDTPAIPASLISTLLDNHRDAQAHLTVTAFEVDDPTGYGRVMCDAQGQPTRIVEHADANDEERETRLVNAGLYVVDRALLGAALKRIDSGNAQGEYYLTDMVQLAIEDGHRTSLFALEDAAVLAGVNTRVQLAEVQETLRAARARTLMLEGVTIEDPNRVWVEHGVTVGIDTVLGANVELRGTTRLGSGCRIDSGVILTDCAVEDGAHVKPYVVAQGAIIGQEATVGPFTQLRAGTELGAHVKIGNFVETKKAKLQDGAKASHLSYLGDCDIGRDVNIGAGTITCNYDGFDKHRTVLEDGVFVGSDTQFVAPVHVGRNATVGAGTTVTGDVPDGALVVSRVPQKVLKGYYAAKRKPREDAKKSKKGS